MDLFGKERIAAIEGSIAQVEARIADIQYDARGILARGRRGAAMVDGHFAKQVDAQAQRLHALIAGQPVPLVAAWDDPAWERWSFATAVEEPLLRVGDLAVPGTGDGMRLPAFVPFIGQARTIILRSDGASGEIAQGMMQGLVVRIAASLPHQAHFTLLDPARAGMAFPMRRLLSHVRENSGDVRRDLDQVIVETQRIIEAYLDAATRSFEQIPREMRINERFRFIFAADFPNGYDRRAIDALQQIGNTGLPAGAYLVIHHNSGIPLPRDVSMQDFKNAFTLDVGIRDAMQGLRFHADGAPSADAQAKIFAGIRRVPPPDRTIEFDATVALPSEQWWTGTTDERIETTIGLRSSGEPLTLWFGSKGGEHCVHGMLAAMTGAGKSTLYDVLITSLAMRYSPAELRLFLIDGKSGVEFQPYRHLPHVEAVSLRTPAELARSVLAELLDEMERRSELFQEVDVDNITDYRRKAQAGGPLPRILLLVDEYQQLFEDDRDGIASAMLKTLTEKGRYVGIHLFVASQRFGVAGMVNQTAVFSNIHLRVAMQMTNEDVQALTVVGRRGKALIAATCDLPGKVVLNDRTGSDDGNAPGKVAMLKSERRDAIVAAIQERAGALPPEHLPRRVVFNGRAQPHLLDNPGFGLLLKRAGWPERSELERIGRLPSHEGGLGIPDWFAAEHPLILWCGQELNVRGQAAVVLRRRTSEHIVIVGNTNVARFGMLGGMLASATVNAGPEQISFALADRGIPGTDWAPTLSTVRERLLRPAGYTADLATTDAEVERLLEELVSELDRRRALDQEAIVSLPSLIVALSDLDRVESLRRRVGSYGLVDAPGTERLARLFAEGGTLGIHLILSFGDVSSLASILDERRALLYFRHRLALQMGEDFSHRLVRSRRAALLQADGPTPICALSFDLDSDRAVRFKPYSIQGEAGQPDSGILHEIVQVGDALGSRQLALA